MQNVVWAEEIVKAETMLENYRKNKSITIKDARLMDWVKQEYSDKQINDLYNLYTNSSFTYSTNIQVGQIVKAKLVGQTTTDFLFDIGYRDLIYVENKKDEQREISLYADDQGNLMSDTEIEILITKVSYHPFLIKASVAGLQRRNAYKDLMELDIITDAFIREQNPAGFNVDVNYDGIKISAFMPNALAGINRLTPHQAESLLGKNIKVMVESFAEEKGTFIISRKKYLQTLIEEKLSNFKNVDGVGKPLSFKGLITGTTDFGVFVEFDECLTGMIHKDNLNDDYKANFKSLKPGSSIEFHVKKVINKKLFLTQVWKTTVWDVIQNDQVYDGEVIKEKNFGFLIRLDEETQGLVHSVEIQKTSKKITVGSIIKVRVLSFMEAERKIYLALA